MYVRRFLCTTVFLITAISFILFYSKSVYADVCPEDGYRQCRSFVCFTIPYYYYNLHTYTATTQYTSYGTTCVEDMTSVPDPHGGYVQKKSTNSYGSISSWPDGVPAGCDMGYYADISHSCSGWEYGGPPGDCPDDGPVTGECSLGQCGACEMYEGDCCVAVPSGCKAVLGCPVDEPTPTPTPAQRCELACPGTLVEDDSGDGSGVDGGSGGSGVDGGSGGSGGTGGTGVDDSGVIGGPLYTGEGSVEGPIEFDGYNGFDCDVFDDGLGYEGACPVPTIVSGGSDDPGGSVDGISTQKSKKSKSLTTSVLGLMTKNREYSVFNRLVHYVQEILEQNNANVLGARSSSLLAQAPEEPTPTPTPAGGVDDGSGGGGSGGGADTGNPGESGTQTEWTSESKRYHIIPEGNQDLSIYQASALDSSVGASCGCQVQVACQTSLQTDPNLDVGEEGYEDVVLEGCDNQCNIVFNPTYPDFKDDIEINIIANDGYENHLILEYDDEKKTILDGAPATSYHTYGAAGVYNVKATCQNPGGGEKTCQRKLNVYCYDPVSLPTPSTTPTPTPGNWIKINSGSVHINSTFINGIPEDAIPYDKTDVGACDLEYPDTLACFNSGNPGVVVVEGTTDFAGAPVSYRGWERQDSSYSRNAVFTPSTFLEYARARKSINEITPPPQGILTAGLIQQNAINLISTTTPLLIYDDTVTADGPFILIVDGDLIINMDESFNNTFNNIESPIIIMVTGTIELAAQTAQLNGIFVANDIVYSYDEQPTNNTLKVSGNIVSLTSSSCTEYRQSENKSMPSCYFDTSTIPQYLLPLIDLLATRNYQWTEVIPEN